MQRLHNECWARVKVRRRVAGRCEVMGRGGRGGRGGVGRGKGVAGGGLEEKTLEEGETEEVKRRHKGRRACEE